MARKTTTEAKERAQERLHTALSILEEGIGTILDSESFARYLRTMSRFHRYSFNNVALIHAQRPDATHVAGYRTWQTLSRQVRKGEKGIAILVPYTYRATRDGEGAAQNAQNTQNTDEERDRGEERTGTRFGVGYVFDIAQTDGEPLPEPPAVQAITTATDRGAALWQVLADWLTAQGVAVEVKDCGRPNGYYAPGQGIVIHERIVGTDQATKTLAHEAAHFVTDHNEFVTREDAETVAEGAAYVVLHHFGLDTSGYSFAYVARWAEDKAVLKRNLEAIRRTASAIIAGIADQTVEEQCAA